MDGFLFGVEASLGALTVIGGVVLVAEALRRFRSSREAARVRRQRADARAQREHALDEEARSRGACGTCNRYMRWGLDLPAHCSECGSADR
jgi:hypothetical protein